MGDRGARELSNGRYQIEGVAAVAPVTMSLALAVKRTLKKVAKWLGAFAAVLILAAIVVGWVMSEPRPRGTEGPEAEALAHAMQRAVNQDAWEATGAVKWRFAGGHEHLWDRERGLSRVAWKDYVVLQRLDRREGVAFERGERVSVSRTKELVEDAWGMWCNDSFWLNPVAKLYDDGVTRSIVRQHDGSSALLVSYSKGGVTPGDAYLWILGPHDLPTAWKMWVHIIPIGGVRASWEGWISLATGAKIATRHRIGPMTLEITEVEGAATLAELEPGPDPFASLHP